MELKYPRSPKCYLFFTFFALLAGMMAASTPTASLLGRPPPPMLASPATTAWANALGLQLNVLNDHLKSIAPEIHQNFSQILNRAVQTVSGAAAIHSAISALAPFKNLHATTR